MAENKDFGFPIPKYDGHYDHWAMLMQNLLESMEFWSIVETGVPVLAEGATAEQRRIASEARLKDLKAKNYLFQSIDRAIIETILDKSSSKAIRDSMKQKFQGSTKVKRAQLQALRGEFENLRMKEDESVSGYFGRVLSTVNKMKIQGEVMEQNIVVEKILRSMTSKFNYVVCAIEEANNVETLSIDELQGSLLVHEQKMKPLKEEDQALKATHGDRNSGRGRGRGAKGNQGRGKRINKENVECYKCHKFGHFQYECQNSEGGGYANYADFDDSEEVLLMAHESTSSNNPRAKVWYIDSGCSNHMCGIKEWFHDLDDSFRESVRLGDDSQMSVMGKGNVKLQMNGIVQVITGVYFIPKLKNNLLSLGQLQEKNLTFIWPSQHQRITKPAAEKYDEFKEFCEVNGIKRQLTAAYTPRQNGIAERKNRTIMEMIRCMLACKSVPKAFWHEAVNWAIYVLNRSPTTAIQDMIPEEVWSSTKPSVKHFKKIGYIAYAHVPDAQRRKLDDKSVKCVLFGISEESKAYSLYNPITKRIIISRDVKFVEKDKWEWDGKSEKLVEQVISDEESDKNNEEHGIEVADTDEEVHSQASTPPNAQGIDHIGTSTSNLNNQGRTRKPPFWHSDYDTTIAEDELVDEDSMNFMTFGPCASEDPSSFEEAVKSSTWRSAMNKEIEAIEKNKTWQLTDLPQGAKVIGRYGTDYKEVIAPVARWDTIRSLLAISASRGWNVYQLDVKSAFLHGELKETVYVEQPAGYVKSRKKDKVYKLHKALYGLKQAPRAWYNKIEAYFIKEGFVKCPHEHTLFVKREGKNWLIISLYVDDIIFTGNDNQLLKQFKESMMTTFDMTDLGKMRHFLGIGVIQNEPGIFICQKRYAKEILERFNMDKSNEVCSPSVTGTKLSKHHKGEEVNPTQFKQIVGSLMYLTATRPDIMFAVNLIARRFMEHPVESHMMAAKRVLRYIRGTLELGIMYKKEKQEARFLAYSDSDYGGDLEDRKSTSGYVFKIGSGAVSWSSKKQPVVTPSSTKAEFIFAAYCACQGIWLQRILLNMGFKLNKCLTVFCDNNSTIKLSKNPVLHGRSKHIDIRFHFLRNFCCDGRVELIHCASHDQVVDIMTKALKLDAFEKLRNLLGVESCSGSD
ncbi:hypothetical protein TSUD_172660 [Trifolium subterraneum]|uniref:Integrase catalytic domain-containing protein n=1 Tax=Trifolium subterraneum TaxID=3900 RepID=A0A2Z6LXY6_TRISU|nr:hypothetical protein TSUD_172660 [Trifolium subterraneum]